MLLLLLLLLLSRFSQSNSVRPHRLQPTRLPHPGDSPGKNTGVGCHFLLQCMKVKVKSLSHVRLFSTPCTVAYQAPPSVGFSRQEYWSGLSLPSLKGIWMRQITSSHGEDGGLEGVRCIWAVSWLSICSSDGAGRRGMEKRTLCTERKGWERLEKVREAWKPVVKTGCPAWQWSAEWKVARRLGQSWDKLHINWEPLGS